MLEIIESVVKFITKLQHQKGQLAFTLVLKEEMAIKCCSLKYNCVLKSDPNVKLYINYYRLIYIGYCL